MEALTGRVGVIGKGVEENVLNVWTRSMHKCADV